MELTAENLALLAASVRVRVTEDPERLRLNTWPAVTDPPGDLPLGLISCTSVALLQCLFVDSTAPTLYYINIHT